MRWYDIAKERPLVKFRVLYRHPVVRVLQLWHRGLRLQKVLQLRCTVLPGHQGVIFTKLFFRSPSPFSGRGDSCRGIQWRKWYFINWVSEIPALCSLSILYIVYLILFRQSSPLVINKATLNRFKVALHVKEFLSSLLSPREVLQIWLFNSYSLSYRLIGAIHIAPKNRFS